MRALSNEAGLRLFDDALRMSDTLMLPVPLELAALRAQARAGVLPELFGDLVTIPARRVDAAQVGSLARRRASTPEHEHEKDRTGGGRVRLCSDTPTRDDRLTTRPRKDSQLDSGSPPSSSQPPRHGQQMRLPAALVFDPTM